VSSPDGTPGGTITFTVNGVVGAPQPIANGSASIALSFPAGTQTISATYSGDANFLAASSGILSLAIDKASSTLTVTSNPAQLEQLVAIRAAPVLVSPASGTATGTVDFAIGGDPIGVCVGLPVQNGAAVCNISFLRLGTFNITANYSGDANTKPSSFVMPLTVGKVLAGMSIASAPVAPVYGTPVTVGVLLSGATGVAAPTGSVSFAMGGATLPSVSVGVDGRASLLFPGLLNAGAYQVTAIYSGDGNYQSSSSLTLNFTVAKAASTLVLTSTPPAVGQAVTVTATLTLAGAGGTADGTVSMGDGGVSICTGVALQTGIATCTTPPLQTGTNTINASYSGDVNTAASTATLALTATKAAAGITTAFTPAAPVFGATVTLTASLVAASGLPMPTGTVAFTDGAAGLGVAPVGADGHASVGTSTLSVGTHSIVAVYSGDTSYQSATAAAASIVVGKAATSVALTSNTAPAGQPVTLTAAVTVVSPGSGTPGGTVDFRSGSTAIAGCTGIAVQNGSAACNTSFAQAGSYTIGASYNGDANTAASTASLTLTTGRSAAAITTAFAPAAPGYGAAVTITATLVGAAGQPSPTGTVAFSDGLTALGTAPVSAGGQASVAVSTLIAGTHSIVAVYSGDANYQLATAAAVSVLVGKAATSMALTSNAAQVGQPVTLTAAVTVVSSGSGTPGGTVDFRSGSTAIAGCTGIATQNGSAACNTSFSQTGNYSIGATYNGDGNTTASTATLALTVSKAVAGIYTAATLSAPPYGAAVTVNALLLGATGLPAPGGTVAFSDGTAALTTVAVGSDGRASLVLGSGANALSIGTHSIAAVYSGDANYQTATAAALAIVVAKAATSVVLASSPAQIGQPVSLKAAVTVVSPGSAALGGTVDFSNGGRAIAGCAGMVLQNGTVACSTSFPQLGTYAIGVSYNGDANTAPGTGTMQVTVGKASAGIYTAFTPAAPVYGGTVAINALLLGATGLGTPTGTILFSDGGSPLATMPVGADGRASVMLPSTGLAPLGGGSHSVVAAYSGDANYVMSTADPLYLTVGKASTSTLLTASAGGILTATVTVVAPGAGAPTGSVQFYQGGTLIGASGIAPQGSGFVATISAGSQSGNIWAVYQGDGNFNGNTSPVVMVAGSVQVSISSDHNPAAAGQAVTFTVRVSASSGAGTPSGSVQLSADGAAVGTGTLAAGQATIIATLTVGSHTITASYSGDAVYAAATATMQQVINKASIALSLTSSAGATVYGQPVTLTAQLGTQSTGGTIQFLDGTAAMGSAPVSAGVATFTAASLAVGVHSIQATWPGDPNSAAAASAVLSQTVSQAQTSTTLTVSGSTLTAAVAVTAPGTGSPTGSVKFLDAATNAVLATTAMTGGSASTAMPATTDAIVAVYSGDANFQTSASSPLARVAVVNAASYAPASFAPDGIASLFGTNLAPATTSAPGPPAVSLGGTTVAITDSAGVARTAGLLFVSAEQLSFLMPADTATGPATVAVTNSNGVATSTAILVARVAPGLFTMNSTGQGVAAAQTLLVHADGTRGAPQDVAVYDQTKAQWVAAPIDLGASGDAVYLLLYGTGIRHYSAMPVCTIGGQTTAAMFAGAQGTFAGLDQVNVALPQSLRGKGSVDLSLTVDGTASNTVTLAFQ